MGFRGIVGSRFNAGVRSDLPEGKVQTNLDSPIGQSVSLSLASFILDPPIIE